jgi:hypothetical protein
MNGAGMDAGKLSPTCILGWAKISAPGGGSTVKRAAAGAPSLPGAAQVRTSGPGAPAWKVMVPVPCPERRAPLRQHQPRVAPAAAPDAETDMDGSGGEPGAGKCQDQGLRSGRAAAEAEEKAERRCRY